MGDTVSDRYADLAISAQPLEKVKVRGGYDSGPSTVLSCKDRRKNSGPS